jgi:membrane protease YdiL (CAAX protease family)
LEQLTKTRVTDLAVVLIITILPAILRSSYFLVQGDVLPTTVQSLSFTAFYNAVVDASGILLLVYILHIRGRSLSDLGWSRRWLDLVFGVALAIGAYLFYAFLLADIKMLFPRSADQLINAKNVEFLYAHFSWSLLLLLLVNPFSEELIVRGYLMTELKAITGSKWWTIVASVLLQTSYHLYQGVGHAFLLGVIFLIFAIFYAGTGRLTPVVIAHLIMDLAILLRLHHR